MNKPGLINYLLITAFWINVNAQHVVTVKANEPMAAIQPTMWGVFFEDINFGADGGIYAEMVKNRSFEFFKPLMGWTVQQKKFTEGAVLVLNRKEENSSNPRFLRVTANNISKGDLSLTNEGFRGMGIKKGLRYDFSLMYHQEIAGIRMKVELVDSTGKVLGDTSVVPEKTGAGWHKLNASLTASGTEQKAKMKIWLEGNGVIDLDMVSLFPSDTWKNRPGGMRADMIQKLADMKPGFIRFPGGCIVEGFDLSQRYQWKKTIGPVDQRQLVINRWNFEFAHRPAPDYFQSFGLGFFEYFQLAEDIGAEPLPILNCGMACQFNSAEVVQMVDLDPYVQDALDLIEFANGDATTKWGKIRKDLGHPAPFNLKMMGIGNENWGPQYIERLKVFTSAIKAKYPGFKLVNSSGTDPSGDRYDYLNNELRSNHADIIDEHYYRRPEWFLQNAGRYDGFPRTGSKVFAGEYAAQSDRTVSINNRNNWQTALSEAAFLTGLERNADVVVMASYAPLFAHVDGWQWTPDLIWVDNLNVYPTPNYYVQQLFSLNKGTIVVPALYKNKPLVGEDSLYVSVVIDSTTRELIAKMVNVGSTTQSISLDIQGVKRLAGRATITTLQSDELEAVNIPVNTKEIKPAVNSIEVKGKMIHINSNPHSLTVLKIKML